MNQQIEEHDVTLLGSGLGGLIAGTLLAQKGLSVVLLRERGYSSSYQKEGYRFTLFSNFSERRLRPSLVQKVARELELFVGKAISEGDSYDKREPGQQTGKVPFQVILPEARIDPIDNPSLLQMEWRREFPKELALIEQFYGGLELLQNRLKARTRKEALPYFPVDTRSVIRKTLSFSSFQEGREEKQFASFSKEFRAFLQLQLVAQGNLLSDAFPVSLTAYLLLHEERGLWVPNLDLPALETAVLDSFLRSGGEVEEIDKPGRVEKHWKKGFTLALEGDRRVFRSRFLILNSPLHSLSDLMKKGGKPIAKGLERLRPRYIVFPCFLGIREKVVPVGMRDLLVSLRDLGRPYEEGNLLFLTFSRRGDESAAPEGRRALTVQTLVPFRERAEVSLAHREAVMGHMNHLIPFLDQHLDFADFEWACEQTGRWSYPHLLYEVTGDFHWREGIVPTHLSGGLYFVGRENFPYLGAEGEVLAGMRTATEILKKHA